MRPTGPGNGHLIIGFGGQVEVLFLILYENVNIFLQSLQAKCQQMWVK